MVMSSRWIVGILLALLAFASEAQSTTISIDARGTYLRTNSDPGALGAVPIDLISLSLTSGSTITLTRLGDFNCHPTCGDLSIGMIAAFSSSSTLLASNQAHRLPGAIDAGVDVVTAATFFGGSATDIPEDFEVSGTGVTLIIPVGATYLFVAAHDSHYQDNGDPDGDFAVKIDQVTAVPAPATALLLSSGLVGLAAWRRRVR